MGTSGSLCWYKNSRASGKPKKSLRRFLKNILVGAFALTSFSSLYSLTQEQIVAKAIDTFSPTLPGLQHILASKSGGKYFELETALYFQKEEPEEVIEGFDLNINFYAGKILANIDDYAVYLATTEFDVITRSFVVECKSVWNDKKGLDGHLKQFVKEQNMIAWMASLVKDIDENRVRIYHRFKDNNKSVFSIDGRCTFNKRVDLTCSWVNKNNYQHTSRECIDQFVSIAHMLAAKSLLVFFKSALLDEFAEAFEAFDIDVYDSIEYVRCDRYEEVVVEEMVSSFSQLVLC